MFLHMDLLKIKIRRVTILSSIQFSVNLYKIHLKPQKLKYFLVVLFKMIIFKSDLFG